MTFVFKEERKFGPKIDTSLKKVGPGAYLSSEGIMG